MLLASRLSSFTAVLIAATRLRFLLAVRRLDTPWTGAPGPLGRGAGRARLTPFPRSGSDRPVIPAGASCQTQHVGSGGKGYAPTHPPSTAFSAAAQHLFVYIFQYLTSLRESPPQMPESVAQSSLGLHHRHNILCPRGRHRKSTACTPLAHRPAQRIGGRQRELPRPSSGLSPQPRAPSRGHEAAC